MRPRDGDASAGPGDRHRRDRRARTTDPGPGPAAAAHGVRRSRRRDESEERAAANVGDGRYLYDVGGDDDGADARERPEVRLVEARGGEISALAAAAPEPARARLHRDDRAALRGDDV